MTDHDSAPNPPAAEEHDGEAVAAYLRDHAAPAAEATTPAGTALCPHGETIPFLVPDAVWEFVVGAQDAGLICPECFTKKAAEKGVPTFCRIDLWGGCDCHLTDEQIALVAKLRASSPVETELMDASIHMGHTFIKGLRCARCGQKLSDRNKSGFCAMHKQRASSPTEPDAEAPAPESEEKQEMTTCPECEGTGEVPAEWFGGKR